MVDAATTDTISPLWKHHEARNPTRVSFRAFALVYAGLADGFALSTLLEHEAIDPRDWPVGEDYWNDCLLDDLGEGAALTFELDACQAIEREKWRRALPPLDDDYVAWLDFGRNLLDSPDPGGMLLRIGLAPGDIGRLTRLWAARCAEDPKLNEVRLEVLGRAPQPVAVPKPEPPRFIDDTGATVDGTGFFGAISDVAASLPFQTADVAKPHATAGAPPPIATPLPRRVDQRPSIDETAAVPVLSFDDAPRAATPFVSAEPPPPLTPPTPPPSPVHPGAAPDVTPHRVAPHSVAPRTPPDVAPPSVVPIADMPSVDDVDIDGTSMMVLDLGKVLPFEGEHAAPALASLPPTADIGQTGVLEPLHIDVTTPFGVPTADGLTVEQLAAIAVELELGTPANRVLPQYRLTEADHKRLQSELEAATSRDGSLRERFGRAMSAYRTWRTGGGR